MESIKISLKINKEEVIKEVEARIAEILLEKRLSDLHIISMNDVNNVIEIMGKPSDYSALDEDEYDDDNQYKEEKTSSYTIKKKLYRDVENGYLGGVLAGLAAYFSIKLSILRLIVILLTIFSIGSPILVYLILWIIIPSAKTASQILEMKGEDITLSKIEEMVKEQINNLERGAEDIKNKISKDYKGKFEKVRSFAEEKSVKIRSFFLVALEVIKKLIGLVLTIFSSTILIGFMIGLIFFTLFSHFIGIEINNMGLLFEMLDYTLPLWLVIASFIIVTLLPILVVLLLGIKLLSSLKYSIWVYIALIVVWITSLFIISYTGLEHRIMYL